MHFNKCANTTVAMKWQHYYPGLPSQVLQVVAKYTSSSSSVAFFPIATLLTPCVTSSTTLEHATCMATERLDKDLNLASSNAHQPCSFSFLHLSFGNKCV